MGCIPQPPKPKIAATPQQKFQRIMNWNFDQKDVQPNYQFAKKISEKTNTPIGSVQQKLIQYRKFLWILILKGQGIPSNQVDQMWNQHIINTKNYFKLIGQVNQGKYIHHPVYQKLNYDDNLILYQKTLSYYAQLFGKQAPPQIWPINETKPGIKVGMHIALKGII